MYNIKLTLVFLFLATPGICQQKGKTGSKTYPKEKSVIVFTTASNTDLRLALTDTLHFKQGVQPIETEISIIVNPQKKFQTCIGIGGAITDASAEVFDHLSPTKQHEFLDAYYSVTKGIGYSLARTNIHSCDFSSDSYTYVKEGDKDLKTFNISHDKQFRIPLIKKAIATTGGNLLIFASPWSPPAFMKDNNDMLHGGKLLPEYNQSWANYFVKFIKAYEKEGIPIWGLTVQNEPLAKQRWESCQFTAEEERDFVKFCLGPTMVKQGYADKKIIVWDHNRDIINQWAQVIFDDPEAAKYIWGTGFHWYETWTGGEPMFNNIGKVNEAYPSKKLLFTEGCVERFDPEKYYFWGNAERYGSAIINDFNNGTVGWTDWNILLDERGGPNHVQNFTFAPIHANTKTGELIYTPAYYYLGHFSKFIRPGAKRVSTICTRSSLLCTSFLNNNGKMVTVVMNGNNQAINYKLYLAGKIVELNILPHAIQTLVY